MKITVVGNALVVTSTLKFEDIEKVSKFKPEALILKNEKDVPIFAIGTTSESGSINSLGAIFDGATRDGEGLATITMAIPFEATNDELKETVAEEYSGAFASLKKLEASIPEVVKELDDAKAEVMRNMQFCD